MHYVPYLIDGNNLMYALHEAGAPVGQEGLCALLRELASSGEKVCVVFDGPSPPEAATAEITEHGVEVAFSGRKIADELIVQRIATNTAPRRLTVVSTDREIRRAGRKRRCKIVLSEQFAQALLRAARPAGRAAPAEPREKRHGLDPQQAQAWLREFGLDDGTQPPK